LKRVVLVFNLARQEESKRKGFKGAKVRIYSFSVADEE
jgi:hypothetical protein